MMPGLLDFQQTQPGGLFGFPAADPLAGLGKPRLHPNDLLTQGPGLYHRGDDPMRELSAQRFNPVNAGELAMGLMGGPRLMPGIRAFHGSPHNFERFDLSKIGTGEGAQAYGHGLYFAENPSTAQAYREALSGNKGLTSVDLATNVFQAHKGDRAAAIAELEGRLSNISPSIRPEQTNIPGALEALKTGAPLKGHMYEVNINAKPEQFLDWDKPLSQMSPEVQSALAPHGIRPGYQVVTPKGRSEIFPSMEAAVAEGPGLGSTGIVRADPTGQSVYNSIASRSAPRMDPLNIVGIDKPSATGFMQEAGIPGIRYLDQGSRGTGTGSSNYVVFNDKIIDILRKYGLAGLTAGGGAAAVGNQDNSGGLLGGFK